MLYTYTCSNQSCQAPFTRPWKSKSAKPFCGRSCSNSAVHRRKPEGKCLQCGANIRSKLKYCSHECRLVAYRIKIPKKPNRLCGICGTSIDSGRKFCSKKCTYEAKNLKNAFHKSRNGSAVVKHRQKRKLMAIDYLGGACALCGYNRCPGALHFHHRNPDEKDFAISESGITRNWEQVKCELDKCILLCGNCHSEVHFLKHF